jgi:serine-type D-Ala-D-Ala carboxypeptidase/endopeptidase (penicillin-binding protein 4)
VYSQRRRDSPTFGGLKAFVRPVLLALALIGGLLAVAAPASPAAGPAGTRATIEQEMRSAGSASGALAVDLDSGRVIARVRPRQRRVPASVQKLYTTSASLLRFGPRGRLRTTVLSRNGPDAAGTLTGNVWIRGGGDPALDAAGLRTLADQVAAAGVRRVEGNLIADESAFDTLRGPPSEGYRSSRWIAPLSGLAYERGRHPASKVPGFFREALKANGVTVTGRMRVRATPARAANALAALGSPPMATLVGQTNGPSDNWYSEQLLKAVGASTGEVGSTAGGAATAGALLRDTVGIRPRIRDGSGLSRANLTTPRQVVRLLRAMDARPEGPALRGSLPVAGRTGTLGTRMRTTAASGRCQAKTGTLSNVSSLAGYCTSRHGSRVAFAFLMNGVYPASARKLQDRMVTALARYRAPAG